MSNHIKAILEVVSENRQEIDELCNEILQEARETADIFQYHCQLLEKQGSKFIGLIIRRKMMKSTGDAP